MPEARGQWEPDESERYLKVSHFPHMFLNFPFIVEHFYAFSIIHVR